MIHLVDNDLIIKIAVTDLLEETCGIFGLEPANTRRLGSLRFVGPKKIAKQKLRSRISTRIIRFCDTFPSIDESVDAALVERLSSPRIDSGEALLIANAIVDREAVLATGDKRCVRALGTDPDLAFARGSLLGRVEILESIYLRLLDSLGFDAVCDRVVANPPIDGMLDLAFRTGGSDKEMHARAALRSAEDEIERLFPGLLRSRSRV